MKKIFIAGLSAAVVAGSALCFSLPIAQAATVTVGNDTSARTQVDTYSNFTIIDTNVPVSASGSLTTFNYYASNQNPFEFVLVDSGNVVKYVSPTITPSATGVQVYTPGSPISVSVGWNLGVHFDSTGTIPFEYVGAPAAYTPNNNGMPTVGLTLSTEGTSDRIYSFDATGQTPAPSLTSANITDNVSNVIGNLAGATLATTDSGSCNGSNSGTAACHILNVASVVVANAPLAAEHDGFTLTADLVQQAALTAYFAGKGWPAPYLTQITSEINGSAPFLYFVSDGSGNYSLADGFQYGLGNGDQPLLIDDTYPAGTYTYTGTVGGNSVTVTLTVTKPAPVMLPAPTLLYPVNGTITTTAGLTSVGWNSVTDSVGGITYVYQSSNSPATDSDGSFTSPAYTSGPLTATSIPTLGTPAGVYYWHVYAKDSGGNTSPWSDAWMLTVDNTPPTPQVTCPAGTTPVFVETVPVNSASSVSTPSVANLMLGQQYLLASSGTWQNDGLNVADTAYASVDNWATHMAGYNIAPYFLGAGEFQLQVDNAFVNWGSYDPLGHNYSYLYTGNGSPVSLGVFDGNSNTNTSESGWYGDNSGNLSVSIYACQPTTGTLIVEKEAIGGNGTFNFTSNIPGNPNFNITTVGGSGSQTFNNLTPGTYHVTEGTTPKGWTMTDNECALITVAAGDASTCIVTNTSNKLLGVIRGTKYEDRDGDGTLKDGDHHRLAGVTINITGPNNYSASTVTDKFGNYRFVGLQAGTYNVSEVVQSGWVETYPRSGSYTINLAAGKISKKDDFGNFKLGTISGMKYNDLNGDGRKKSNEPGLPNWTISLKGPGSNGPTITTTTDSSGNYSFANLMAGTYTLSEIIPPATPVWHQTQYPGSIKIQSGTVSKNDNFGNTQKVISDKDKDHGYDHGPISLFPFLHK